MVSDKEEVMKIEIPVEEVENKKEKSHDDILDELRDLGRQFGETIRSAWSSEERKQIESEVREGVTLFVSEVDKAIRDVRQSDAAKKVKTEAGDLREKMRTGELSSKTRQGVVDGVRWLSEELGRLAERFTPQEKAPDEAAADDEEKAA